MSARRFALTLALAASLAAPALATEGTAPPRRAHHALAFDPVRGQVLLTAGSTPLEGGNRFEFFRDLWGLDSCGWHRLGESGERVSGVGLAWDARRSRLLSFGGYDGRASIGALRVLRDGEWEVLDSLPRSPVAEPGLVYDAARDRLLAFGGSADRGRAADATWSWSEGGWRQLEAAGPPPRQAHVMVYDAARKRVVLFGGMGQAPAGQRPPRLGDTWEFDGTRWKRFEVEGPAPRASAGATYDSKRGRVIVFGGSGADGFLGDTWAWDGRAWRRLAESGPEPRAMGALAYDVRRDRVVMFGGRKGWPDGDLDDTWEWDGATWRPMAAASCADH